MKIEESILIERAPEDVFAFFSARENDERWMSSVLESEWVGADEPVGLGRRGRMVMNAMGRRTFEDVVTEYEPGRRVGHRSVSRSMIIRTSCSVAPDGERCRATVTYEPERLPGGLIGKLFEPITSRVVRRNFRSDLRKLKEIMEQG